MNRRALLRTLALSPLLASTIARAATPALRDTIAASFGLRAETGKFGRIVAAGPVAAVLVYALVPDALLGWPSPLSPEAMALLPRVRRDLPHLGRLSGRGSTLGTEALLALRPDLILDAGSVDPTHVSGAEGIWQQTGVPFVLIDGRLADHPAQLRDVGRLLGAETRGEYLAGEARRIFDLAETVLAQVAPDERPRVYYGRSPDGLETGRGGSINVEAIEFSGGRNVAAQSGRGGLTQASMEQLLVWDPEVILTQDAEFARRIPNDPLWRGISAVRNHRIHLAPSLPFGWIDGPPGINRLIGVRWLLSILHPGRHPELSTENTAAAAIAFHRTFYGTELTQAGLDKLLGEAA